MRHHPPTHFPLSSPMTALAVSMLLAACGGGGNDGGSNRAVSSSPTPTTQSSTNTSSGLTTNINITTGAFAGTGAIAEAISHGTPPSTPKPNTPPATGTGTPAPTSPTAPNNDNQSPNNTTTNTGTPPTSGNAGSDANGTASVEPTQPATPKVVPLVSNEGVRGEVVLAMMDQRACNQDQGIMKRTTSVLDTSEPDYNYGTDTPWLTAATRFSSEAYTYDMDKWKIEGRHIPTDAPYFVYECRYRDIRSYSNPVQPGSHTFSMYTYPGYICFHCTPINNPSSSHFGKVTKGINTLRASYQISVTTEQASIGAEAQVLQEEDFDYRTIETPDHKVPAGARRFDTVLGGATRQYGRQALVPFGALNQWQDGAGNYLQLVLIKADEPNTIRLCTHFDGVLAKRLHCVTWEVPTDWSWGKELLGGTSYLIDDRSVYRNESGFLYWRTNRTNMGAQVEREAPQAG